MAHSIIGKTTEVAQFRIGANKCQQYLEGGNRAREIAGVGMTAACQ